MPRHPIDIADGIFGPDIEEPLIIEPKVPNSHPSAQGAAIYYLANADFASGTNFVDVDRQDMPPNNETILPGDATTPEA